MTSKQIKDMKNKNNMRRIAFLELKESENKELGRVE